MVTTKKEPVKLGRKPSRPKKPCLKCGKQQVAEEHFYKSSGDEYADGLYPICKKCVNETLDINDLEQVKDQLLKLNRPFIKRVWDASHEEAIKRNRAVFGNYIKNIQLGKMAQFTWKDSEFEESGETKNDKTNNVLSNSGSAPFEAPKLDSSLIYEYADKWGYGYTPEEYVAFERKYNQLKNNYPERTALHTESLFTYIRYRVKEEFATAKGDSKVAKEWAGLAKDAATAAKINPSQLSKADLSDGLDNFGQLVRSVEQAVDIIPILPQFRERPNDKPDLTIWCYINYERRLHGLPLVEYKEIYEFYEQRARDYESNQKDNALTEPSELDFLNEGDE